MLTLYRFEHSERDGDLSGLFVEDSSTIENLLAGPEGDRFVHFGEVLGKHSEVGVLLTHENITSVSDSPEDLALFKKLLPYGFAYNPLDYLYEDDE